ncbi:relaxosome protein TraM [Enterobacter kobei]|uniref:conjugal transfer relaxosome DNA-binding protein TraM n=1 Tax=Enterobacter roggenkampii TaxID=1812935 RepID=UPI00084C9C9E|nr:conjugal transfer relaxosome DNA-binding protein TraM [Enterobacter roggenkampii]AOP97968.1 conjugal transfer protein TraM [Enterobacter roggenkampii]ELE9247885.1 relaxosome protein TraM [Enterobacter kobei]QWZ75428.1 relaxosome protein TraM [Enterobacter roggenkampii]
MPKIQTYCNNNVYEQISDLVTLRKQEGVEDASFSNVSSMLLELGLRVYMIQRERKEGGFNQMEYNKVMLESMSRVRAMCSEIMKMSALSPEAIDSGHFILSDIKPAIEKFARQQVNNFFPDDGGEDS